MTSVSLNNSYCLYFSLVILHHSSFCINLIGCFRHGPRSRSFGKGPSWLFQRGQFLPLRPSVRCVFRKYDTEAPWFKEHLWDCGCDFANPSALVYLLKKHKSTIFALQNRLLVPSAPDNATNDKQAVSARWPAWANMDIAKCCWTTRKEQMKMKQEQLRHTSPDYNTKHAKVQHRLAMWCWPMLNSTGFGYR